MDLAVFGKYLQHKVAITMESGAEYIGVLSAIRIRKRKIVLTNLCAVRKVNVGSPFLQDLTPREFAIDKIKFISDKPNEF